MSEPLRFLLAVQSLGSGALGTHFVQRDRLAAQRQTVEDAGFQQADNQRIDMNEILFVLRIMLI